MPMVVAYFDETGTHGPSNFTAVCGFVGTTIEWARLERPWATLLAAHGVTEFHGSKCPREILVPLTNALADEIAKRDLDVVVASMAKQDWDRCASAEIKARFVTPYHFCFEFMLHKVVTWSRTYAGGEPVALVFAHHQEYGTHAAEIHNEYHHSAMYPHLGSLSSGEPKELVALQAADLLSYETYRYMTRRIDGGGAEIPLSPALTALVGMMSSHENAGLYDCENIAALKPSGGLVV